MRPSAHSPARTFAHVSRASYAWMSTKLAGSFGSYLQPFFGSRATRNRISPSSSHSHMTACRTRPFTGKAASNSSPDLIGFGTARGRVAASINPPGRRGRFKPCRPIRGYGTRGSGHRGRTSRPQLPDRLGDRGPAPEGDPGLGRDPARRGTDARGRLHPGGEAREPAPPGPARGADHGRRDPCCVEGGGARGPRGGGGGARG